MRVKITQPGWEKYSGTLGTATFVDGASVDDMNYRDAMALGGSVTLFEVDADGNELGQISPALELIKTYHVSTEVAAPLERGSEVEDETVQEVEQNTGEGDVPAKLVYTVEDLEAVASEKGIGGLREIAQPFGVKNTAIKGLIAEIMNAQRKAKD